jgi:hypothetical protein
VHLSWRRITVYKEVKFGVEELRLRWVSKWAGIAQSVQRLATAWTVWDLNPGGGEIFRTHTNRTWDPPSLLYNGYWVSFPGVKVQGVVLTTHPSHLSRLKKEYSYRGEDGTCEQMIYLAFSWRYMSLLLYFESVTPAQQLSCTFPPL